MRRLVILILMLGTIAGLGGTAAVLVFAPPSSSMSDQALVADFSDDLHAIGFELDQKPSINLENDTPVMVAPIMIDGCAIQLVRNSDQRYAFTLEDRPIEIYAARIEGKEYAYVPYVSPRPDQVVDYLAASQTSFQCYQPRDA